MDWENIKNTLIDFAKNGGITLLKFVAVLIIGIIAIKLILHIIRAILRKSKMETITQSFIVSVIKFSLNLLLIIILIQILGIPITGFIAILSAAGLAISLALQDSLSNLANGVILISTKPFKEGDYITVDDVEGSVVSIKMLNTKIRTPDNKVIIIPNSKITNSSLTNYNGNKTRRVDFNFSVSYATDIDKAKSIISDVMVSDGRVLLDPSPFVALKKLEDSNVLIFANCWCDTSDYWGVYYYVMDTVFNEFKKHGISIDYPHMEVKVSETSPALPYRDQPIQERVEKVREEHLEGDLLDKIIQKSKQHKSEKSHKNNSQDTKSQKNLKTKKERKSKREKKPNKKVEE